MQSSYPGTHDTANAGFLSAAYAKHTEGSDYYLGTTVDQLAAKQIGQDTQLPSLELCMDLDPLAGVCNNGYACVYMNCLSWSSPTTPLPSEAHPRKVFERLFGEGGSFEERQAALERRASLLDSFNDGINRLKGVVGNADRARLDQYLESIREVERQIERAEAATSDNPTPDLDRPVGVPESFADHAKLMFDLQLLALQADITRVITFQLTRELTNRTYPEIGVPDAHHPTSHHGNDPEKLRKIARINAFHVSLFSDFIQKLKTTPDGDGTLLDNTVYVYGSGMGNSQSARSCEPADSRRGRRRGRHEGWAAHPLREGQVVGESPSHALGQGGRRSSINSATATARSRTSSIRWRYETLWSVSIAPLRLRSRRGARRCWRRRRRRGGDAR